jgi:hypothetical protein
VKRIARFFLCSLLVLGGFCGSAFGVEISLPTGVIFEEDDWLKIIYDDLELEPGSKVLKMFCLLAAQNQNLKMLGAPVVIAQPHSNRDNKIDIDISTVGFFPHGTEEFGNPYMTVKIKNEGLFTETYSLKLRVKIKKVKGEE